ncbi:MAG: ABC transporter ATP-binding protein, partial [Lachnospiraceae bacterium]|nr:ABC transporter ATP-binding protein [Lachnospiraceae bacterium]
MGESRIQLQGLTKYYYSDMAVTRALRNIELSFGKNEFVAVIGESGSGKSTLLRVISGMEEFDEGELLFDGQPTSQYDDDEWEHYRRERIGYIFQDYSLIEHYSVRNNIVSVLRVMGVSRKQAVQKADYYLEQVGLKGMENKPASKLSSGQKQRLSIARALAKGTDIIVADEPTGNLDSKTGEQIVRLLKDLSQDHLVIMVTHNYEQVEPYATRIVRLHNGELVLDVRNGQEAVSETKDTIASVNRDRKRFAVRRSAFFLARLNIYTQPGMTVLFLLFFMVITTASFFFIGELLINEDDRLSMEYDNSAFPKEDKTRIIAKRQDGKPIMERDLETIRPMRHVVQVDQYDNVNDFNYYYRENQDYQIQYGYINEDSSEIESIDFLDDSHYMRSSSCIRQEDLTAGKLPEKRSEVVLCAKDGENRIGTTFTCYLKHRPLWGSGQYVRWEFTVVGMIGGKEEQLYFSPSICQMLTAMLNCDKYEMTFFYVKEAGKYLGHDTFIPFIGESLQGDELQVSRNYKVSVYGAGSGSIMYNLPKKPEDIFSWSGYLWFKNYLEIFHQDSNGEWKEPIKLNADNVKTDDLHLSSGAFLAMSEEWFAEYNDMNTYQTAIYISSYAKTTEVLQTLQDAGYDAISTYQASVKEYDPEKVKVRLTHLSIALAVLLVLLIAEVLILGFLMKLRHRDFAIWKFMGMNRKLMYRICYYEMGFHLLVAMMLSIAAMWFAGIKFTYIHEMWYYYELPG